MHLTNKFDQAIIQIRFYFQCIEIIIIIKKFIIHEKYENIKKVIKIGNKNFVNNSISKQGISINLYLKQKHSTIINTSRISRAMNKKKKKKAKMIHSNKTSCRCCQSGKCNFLAGGQVR